MSKVKSVPRTRVVRFSGHRTFGQLQNKHDAAVYKRAYASLAVDGVIVAAVAGRVIKIHWMFGQAAAAVEGNFRDAAAGNIIGHFKFNDREGFCPGFVSYPASMFNSAVGGAFYCDYSTAAQAYFMVVYTDADTV